MKINSPVILLVSHSNLAIITENHIPINLCKLFSNMSTLLDHGVHNISQLLHCWCQHLCIIVCKTDSHVVSKLGSWWCSDERVTIHSSTAQEKNSKTHRSPAKKVILISCSHRWRTSAGNTLAGNKSLITQFHYSPTALNGWGSLTQRK